MRFAGCDYGITLNADGSAQIQCRQPCGGYNVSVLSAVRQTLFVNGDRIDDTTWILSLCHLHPDPETGEGDAVVHRQLYGDTRDGFVDYADRFAIGASERDPTHGLGNGVG